MADLTPEVLNALVRLMNRELDYGDLDDETLFVLGSIGKDGRRLLHEATVVLRDRGYTFAQLGERWGVTESAASRWVHPPQPPGRRPRDRDELDDAYEE